MRITFLYCVIICFFSLLLTSSCNFFLNEEDSNIELYSKEMEGVGAPDFSTSKDLQDFILEQEGRESLFKDRMESNTSVLRPDLMVFNKNYINQFSKEISTPYTIYSRRNFPKVINQKDPSFVGVEDNICTFAAMGYYLKSYQNGLREEVFDFTDRQVGKEWDVNSITVDLQYLYDAYKRKWSIGDSNGADLVDVLHFLSKYGALSAADVLELRRNNRLSLKIEKHVSRSRDMRMAFGFSLYDDRVKELNNSRKKNLVRSIKFMLKNNYPLVIRVNKFSGKYHRYCENNGEAEFSLDSAVGKYRWKVKDSKWNGDIIDHTVLLVGYNKKSLIFLNSYGQDWGSGGLGSISIDGFFDVVSEVIFAIDQVPLYAESLDKQVRRLASGLPAHDTQANGTSIIFNFEEISPLQISNQSPLEKLNSPNVKIELTDYVKQYFLQIRSHFPVNKEKFIPEKDVDSLGLINTSCLDISINKEGKLRFWGSVKKGRIPNEINKLAYEIYLIDQNGCELAEVKSSVMIDHLKFDQTVTIHNDLLLSQIDTFTLQKISPIKNSEIVEEEINVLPIQLATNINSQLDVLKLSRFDFLDYMNAVKQLESK